MNLNADFEDHIFDDVREVERRQRQEAKDRILLLKSAISIAQGVASLENSPGYSTLRTALEDMLSYRTSEMMTATTDRTTAVAQGRCLELRAILSVVGDAKKKAEALAIQLEIEENALRDLEKTHKPLKGQHS